MIEGLNQEAWDLWVNYRKKIGKSIKPVSEHAAMVKLSRYGEQQMAVVQQSIENSWQGLFDLKIQKKTGEKPKKTSEQVAADNEWFERQKDAAIKAWEKLEPNPLNRLKLCDALWARYTIQPGPDTPEQLEWLKGVIAMYLREANAAEVLGDPGLSTMVWCFFGKKGIDRLKARA
jgi:hypothetical protein